MTKGSPASGNADRFPSRIWRFVFAIGCALIGCFAGLGAVSMGAGILAGDYLRTHNQRLIDTIIAAHIVGGVLGIIAGVVVAVFVIRLDARTAAEMDKKYVGAAGRWDVFSGAVFLLIAMLTPAYDLLARTVGERAAPYVALGVIGTVFLTGMALCDHIPRRFIIPIGIIGWILTFAVACWYFWFGPGALGHT